MTPPSEKQKTGGFLGDQSLGSFHFTPRVRFIPEIPKLIRPDRKKIAAPRAARLAVFLGMGPHGN